MNFFSSKEKSVSDLLTLENFIRGAVLLGGIGLIAQLAKKKKRRGEKAFDKDGKELKAFEDIPGPTYFGIPLAFLYTSAGRLHDYREELRLELGDIIAMRRGKNEYIVTITDADEAKRILTDKTFVRGSQLSELGAGLLDNALFSMATDDTWKLHRKLLQPAFGPSHIKDAAFQSIKVSNKLTEGWKDAIRRNPSTNSLEVNVPQAMEAATLDVIGLVAFSLDFKEVDHLLSSSENDTSSENDSAIWRELGHHFVNLLIRRTLAPKWLWSFFNLAPHSGPVYGFKKRLYSFMEGLIENFKEQQNNKGEKMENVSTTPNVMQRLLECKDLSEEEVLGELTGFSLAGHETSSNTLLFCIKELGLNPAIQEKLHQDVKDYIPGEDVLQTLPNLKYLEIFLKETQRLYSIVPRIPRETLEDTSLLGYFIPKRTFVVVSINGIHRNEKFYKEPLKFYPERWIEDSPPSNAFLPFGDGAHNCIGRKIAIVELKLFLISLVKNFLFTSIEASEKLSPKASLTLHLKGFTSRISLRD